MNRNSDATHDEQADTVQSDTVQADTVQAAAALVVEEVAALVVEDSPQSRFSKAQIAAWKEKSMRMFEDAKEMFARCGPAYERGDPFARDDFIKRFGWAVPDRTACEKIVSKTTGDFLSIGCGLCAYELGMLPFLAEQDRAMTCTDIEHQRRSFVPMEKMSSVEAVRTLGSKSDVRTCFFSWPAYQDSHTVRALKARSEPFPYLVYIGEDDGCTGDDELHEYLDKMYSCIEDIDIPRWGGVMGMHDSVRIFKKKE
jgi:hypothetical protein